MGDFNISINFCMDFMIEIVNLAFQKNSEKYLNIQSYNPTWRDDK